MRICLVGATHPCHNPRLVREADTLVEAGHDVRVVAPSFMPELAQKDIRLMSRRRWRLGTVDYVPHSLKGAGRSFFTRSGRRAFTELFKLTGSPRFAERAYAPAWRRMTALAIDEKADLFIAHAHAALSIAAAAATRWRSALAFDCEDLLSEGIGDPHDIVILLEKQYLLRCEYVSVPSEAIGQKLVDSYQIPAPVVLYNVFPKSMINVAMNGKEKMPSRLKVHWFGQTIGSGRGLEEAVEALSLLLDKTELHLRGQWAPGYEQELRSLANRLKVTLIVHPCVDHDEIINSLTEFDVGLALERIDNGAYARTVSNKLGSYMLAGLALAVTDTPGQREILGEAPEAGFLYSAGDAKSLAKGLTKWIENREALQAAQTASSRAAQDRFCWDIEKEKFLSAIRLLDERLCAA